VKPLMIKADKFKKNVIKFKSDWNNMVGDDITNHGQSPWNKIVKYNITYDKASKCYVSYGYYDDGGNGIINKSNGSQNPNI